MSIQRFPSLAHWGAFTAVVENERVIACEPFADDPAPSPMLNSIPALVHSPLRIDKPAIRRGWREGRERSGSDPFDEIPWDEALDIVAAELERVRSAHGPSGIFGGSYGWSSAGRVHHARTLVRRFLFLGGGCVDQVGNYSWGAAQFILPHIIGTYSPVTGRVTDWRSVVENAELVIAFGGLALKNAQVTSGGAGVHMLETWLRRAKQAGVEFAIVSPSRGDSPEFLEASQIAVRPGTDTALMLAMAHVLVSEGRHDETFLARYTTGFDRFRAYLLGEGDGQPKSPEWAAAITGIAADDIRALARLAAEKRTLITCSWSLQRGHHGEQPYWMAVTLAAMLGGVGLPGQGFAFGHGSLNSVGVPRANLPGPEIAAPLNPAELSIPAARLADMLLQPGRPYTFNGETFTYPDVRLVYWAGGNPFHHHQDLNRLRLAWQKPETIIVHDNVWTATARHADIVLPATTPLERKDIGGSSRDPYILAMHQAIAPVGEARNDFDIFRALAARAGYEEAFTGGLDEMGWVRRTYERVRAGCADQGVELPDFETFWARGHVELPEPEKPFILFEDFRKDPAAHPLRTPSGRIEIYSETIAGFGYADCPPHPTWLPPAEWLGSATAERWPIHLLSHQPADRLHSQLDPTPLSQANKVAGRERIYVNPEDAEARGLKDGDVVRVFNDRGACLAGVAIDPGLRPRVAILPTGAWYDPPRESGLPEGHGNPNVLSLDIGTSSLAQATSAQTALVEIERWRGKDHPIRAWTSPVAGQQAPERSP